MRHKLFVVGLSVAILLSASMTFAQAQARKTARKPSPAPAAKIDPGMNNDHVIKMVKAGLSEEVILTAIQAAETKSFDTTADGLIALKVGGVPDRIILVMQGKISAVAAVAEPVAPKPPSPDDPASPHDQGIYAKIDGKMTRLEPAVFTKAKMGGLFGSAMTMGIKKTKIKAVIKGRKAPARLPASPEFFLYFEPNTGGLMSSLGITKPEEFVLAKLSADDEGRSLIVGQGGLTGISSGTRSEDCFEFSVEKISNGIFKVIPKVSLQANEYVFVYGASALATGGTSAKMFDFGVDK